MSKIEVLKQIQKFLVPLGVYSNRPAEPTNDFFISIGPYYTQFFVIICLTLSPALFAYKNSSQIALVLQTTSLIVGGSQSAGMFISLGLNVKKMKILHLKLQEICDNGLLWNIFYLIW